MDDNPDSKVRVANMGPTWDLSAPGETNFDPSNFAIREFRHLKLSNLGIEHSEQYIN